MGLNKYTISIYTEDNVGLLNRISAIFLKRHINIISITSSESEISNIFRIIIVVQVDFIQIKKLVKQIEKQIEVIAAFYHTDDETIFLETALYKVKSESLFEPCIINLLCSVLSWVFFVRFFFVIVLKNL